LIGQIGSYKEIVHAVANPESARNPEFLQKARELTTTRTLTLQWIPNPNAKNAEKSFFTINQAGAAIEASELQILRLRTTANALAARAIVRAGTGHKYWSRFGPEKQKGIETIAAEIYEALFSPEFETPIRTLDLPVAGKGYSGLPLLFDLVNIVSPVPPEKFITVPGSENGEKQPPPDADGTATIECLTKVRKVMNRISGINKSSMGLHPAVYFYSPNGRYQQTAFLGVVHLCLWLESANHYSKFLEVRRDFEEFLLNHKNVVADVQRLHGSGLKSYTHLSDLFRVVLQQLESKATEKDILDEMTKQFPYVMPTPPKSIGSKPGKKFTVNTKSGIGLKQLLETAHRCCVCGSRIHVNSISYEHIEKKADGGFAIKDNGALSHPLCNSLKG
jgi:hypothetical protein